MTGEEQAVSEPAGEMAEQTAGNQVENAPVLNFTEDTVISWPLQGSPVIDYSMDATVYFPTLDVYKYSPAMVLGAPEGTPVCAAAEGTVTGISEDAEIGTVMTVDVGNGYEMIYGQLKDVTVEEGQVLSEGEQLASVSAPTKYYAEEGSNLYFAMRKDALPQIPPLIWRLLQNSLHRIAGRAYNKAEMRKSLENSQSRVLTFCISHG